jgi:hypothetical protein
MPTLNLYLGFHFDVEEVLGVLFSRFLINGEERTKAACPPFLLVLYVADEVRGKRTLNGETDLGHLSIVGLGEEFLGIGFLTAG